MFSRPEGASPLAGGPSYLESSMSSKGCGRINPHVLTLTFQRLHSARVTDFPCEVALAYCTHFMADSQNIFHDSYDSYCSAHSFFSKAHGAGQVSNHTQFQACAQHNEVVPQRHPIRNGALLVVCPH